MRIDPVIAIKNPIDKNNKFRAPLISLYNRILHKEEKMGGAELEMGKVMAWLSTSVALKKQTLPAPHIIPLKPLKTINFSNGLND